MSGTLTVIGGHSSTQGLTGLVTVPAGFTGASALVTSLQSLLTADSALVSSGGANFENLNVAGQTGPQSATVGSFAAGILEITNTSSVGTTIAGSANISLAVPSGYNTLVVQAPGSETITGNGGNNMLAVFGAQSTVNFNSNGGSGTIFAGGAGDMINASGVSWSIIGAAAGNDTLVSSATSAAIALTGAGNLVESSSQNVSIQAGGSSDVIVATGSNSNVNITVTGHATIQNTGSADTIHATGTGAFVGYFGGSAGGIFDFINSSASASSIIAGLNSATGMISSEGSVTVSGSTGGGVYDGGDSGNNSLVGGSGAVTLFAAGEGNYLFANGAPTGAGYNILNAFSGSNDTLIAGAGSTNNVFFAGTGTESMASGGSGAQTFFVGTYGSETISGSTVSGASNTFIFNQAASQGGGTDLILHFKAGEGFINPNNGVTGVTIHSFESISGVNSGTEIDLSNGTTIKLLGVSPSSFAASIIGGTKF